MNAWVKGAVSVGSVVAALTAAAACGSDEERPPAVSGTPGTGATGPGGNGGSSGTGTDKDGGGTAINCGGQLCVGEGRVCVENTCQCKEGYVREPTPDGDDFICAVDKNCVKLRYLEDRCRVKRGAAPQVGLFFAVDYCAGTAVLPEDIDLATSFEVREDGNALNSESDFRVVQRDVESFVMIVLDVSDSILENADLLAQVTSELQDFVTSLESEAGEPPVTVGLIGFARTVETIVPFTQDRSRIVSTLQSIQEDPVGVLTPIFAERIGDEVVPVAFSGTSLMNAVEKGIRETERMQLFRQVVSNNGVLTSGTVVTITDGDDTNEAPVPTVVDTTLVNMVSVGIHEQIDGDTLSAIGRDGAFLAPTSESREQAFEAVSKRVDEHPDRAYLMVYCSASNENNHSVDVSVRDKTNLSTAGCEFRGELLGNLACDVSSFEQECAGVECGGFFACGACPDEQCCVGGTGKCASPAQNSTCKGQDHVCEPSDDICNEIPDTDPIAYVCGESPRALGEECTADRECPVGAFCDTITRVCSDAVIATGHLCRNPENVSQALSGRHCEGLNCRRRNDSQDFRCAGAPARMFEACSGSLGNAVCEVGTRCAGSACSVQGPVGLFRCGSSAECASGQCDTGVDLCVGQSYCHYSWADKLE